MNIRKIRRQKVDACLFCELVGEALELVFDHGGNGDDFLMALIIRYKDRQPEVDSRAAMSLGMRAYWIVTLPEILPLVPAGAIHLKNDGGMEISKALIKAMARCSRRGENPDPRSLRRYFKKFHKELA
jgi:hypothetical protein